MEKKKKLYKKLHLPTIVATFAKHPYIMLITLMLPIMIAIYHFGSDNMAAKKDREYIDRTIDLNRQHQEELNDKQKECDEWKEKYFSIINAHNMPTNNSP
ncbi:MAG: hypothetical protein K2G11_05165 [Muribaculaceae bacterium]|nr:hypothetical protein [Muribaculaceae bacterium]